MPMPASFVLLLLAIVAVWLPSLRLPLKTTWRLPPWLVVYVGAVATAAWQGHTGPGAIASLVVLVLLATVLKRQPRAVVYWPVFALLLLLCVALSLHLVPGFRNPIAMEGVRFSADARPFTQYLNFDKGSVGLVLLTLLAPRLRRGDAVLQTLAASLLLTLVTAATALGLALALGLVGFDPKWPPQTLHFLVTNLLLTCIAEEALFRVMVQDPLSIGRAGGTGNTSAMPAAGTAAGAAAGAGASADAVGVAVAGSDERQRINARAWMAICVSALLFGAAHAGGGARMVGVVIVAELGYAFAYQKLRRIEAPVLVHFGVNALHFIALTYPLRLAAHQVAAP